MTDLERAQVEGILRQISRLYERAAGTLGGARGDHDGATRQEQRAIEQIGTAKTLAEALPERWR